MTTDTLPPQRRTTVLKYFTERNLISRFGDHLELIAALTSGILILTAWIGSESISHSWWITLHLAAFVIGGFAKAKEGIQDTIADKELNVEMLMIFAAVGSAAIGYWAEGAILIFIFALSGALETYTLKKSNKEISSLMELQPERALRIVHGKEEVVPVTSLNPGDHILVRAGERIPADGIIREGITSVDESAITGESVPVNRFNDHEVFAGTVALDGTITVEITKHANETLFQKIINLVQTAQEEKSPSQLFIERFEGTYVKIVLLAVAVMMIAPYLFLGWSLSESIYRAMILLVVASPCALVASIMPATLSAISNSAKKGVLFKGGVHVENLSHINAIAFDKTGTLTSGKPEVTDFYVQKNTDKEVIAATAAAIERESTHPLAKAITAYGATIAGSNAVKINQVKTVSGNGVTAFAGKDKWEIGKAVFVGEQDAFDFSGGIAERLAKEGKSLVFVKRNNEIVAVYGLKDTIRKDTKQAIATLKKHGIHTVMLTGDNEMTATAIATEAGVDDFISECLPEEKVHYVKQLRKKFKNVAMVGDGINDAPALASANVGIAMGNGTDVAIETADVVLMKSNLPRITDAILLSGRMNRVVKQNIIFSLGVILLLLTSNFLQILDLPLGVIGHEGSTILVILNGLRLLK